MAGGGMTDAFDFNAHTEGRISYKGTDGKQYACKVQFNRADILCLLDSLEKGTREKVHVGIVPVSGPWTIVEAGR